MNISEIEEIRHDLSRLIKLYIRFKDGCIPAHPSPYMDEWVDDIQRAQPVYNERIYCLIDKMLDPTRYFKTYSKWRKYYTEKLYDSYTETIDCHHLFQDAFEDEMENDHSVLDYTTRLMNEAFEKDEKEDEDKDKD